MSAKAMQPKKASGTIRSNGIHDFTDYVARQAEIMERSGWQQEATGLRRWISELRDQSLEPPYSSQQGCRVSA